MYRNRTNKKFYVVQVGPCKRCGFAGQINDYQEAERLGLPRLIITCPECAGTGQKHSEVPLEMALQSLGFDVGID